MLEFSCPPSTCRIRELEWPQKVGGLFKVRTSSDDFVNKILDAKNIKLSKSFFDNGIVCERNALLIDFAVSAFVDQFTNRLQVGFTICDVGLDKSEHLLSRLGSFNENTVIDLKQTEQLQNFARLWSDFVDTSNTNNKIYLGLSRDVEVTGSPCSTLQSDLLLLLIQILLYIRLRAFEDDFSLSFGRLTSCCGSDETFLPGLFVLFTFLEESLRYFNCLVQHAKLG